MDVAVRIIVGIVITTKLATLFRRNDVMDVLFMAAQRTRIAVGFITALNGAIKRLPITVRLHVTCQVVVPFESL